MANTYKMLVQEEVRKAEAFYGVPWRVMREILENRKLRKLIQDMWMIENGGQPCSK